MILVYLVLLLLIVAGVIKVQEYLTVTHPTAEVKAALAGQQ